MKVIDVGSRMGRCQLVLGSDGVTLVDAGADPSAKAIVAALAAAGASPADVRRIILTHGDGDHIAGARAIQDQSGAEVIAHELEVAYIGGQVPHSFPIAKRAFGIFGRRLPRPRVTRVMTGSRLEAGELEIVFAPGHTPGHVVVYAGDALLAGDTFRTGDAFVEVPSMMTVDLGQSRTTIRRLAERQVSRVFCGHGPPVDDGWPRLLALAARLQAGGPKGDPQDPARASGFPPEAPDP